MPMLPTSSSLRKTRMKHEVDKFAANFVDWGIPQITKFQMKSYLLPSAYVVWGKVMFSQACVIFSTGGGVWYRGGRIGGLV